MSKKNYYRKVARCIDRNLYHLEALHKAETLPPDVTEWAKTGEHLFDKYKTLRDKESV